MVTFRWDAAVLLTLTLCRAALLAAGAETNTSTDLGSEELGDLSGAEDLKYSGVLWAPIQYSSKLQWQANHLPSHDGVHSQGGEEDAPLNVGVNTHVQEPLYDESQKPISVSKRAVSGISNWGSNPYLLGKRPSDRAFWIPRGKKDVRDNAMNPSSERENSPYSMTDSSSYDSLVDPYDSYALSMPYWNGDVLEDEGQNAVNENFRRLSLEDGTAKRRDRLFWAARGKRQRTEDTVNPDDSETYPEKRSSKGLSPEIQKALWKNNGDDGTKFWMSRGRRFWPARGKKAVEPATFNRLARLVNSGYRQSAYNLLDTIGQNELVPEHTLGYQDLASSSDAAEQPIFWVVRGKKAESSTTDAFSASDENGIQSSWNNPSQFNGREKKAFNDFASALSRLKGRELKVPNFWANRGRKNFWAARGKRDISH